MRHKITAAWALFALAGCATTHRSPEGATHFDAVGSPRQAPNLIVASAAVTALEDPDRAVYVASSRDGVTVSATPAFGAYGLPMTGYGIVSGMDPREIESLHGTAAARQARYGGPALPPPQGRTPATPSATIGRTSTSGGDPIVPCPTDREPRTVAEQAACAELTINLHLEDVVVE